MTKSTYAIMVAIILGILLVVAVSMLDNKSERSLIGVTAQCKDGMFTATPRGRGVCSGHGGVERWIEK